MEAKPLTLECFSPPLGLDLHLFPAVLQPLGLLLQRPDQNPTLPQLRGQVFELPYPLLRVVVEKVLDVVELLGDLLGVGGRVRRLAKLLLQPLHPIRLLRGQRLELAVHGGSLRSKRRELS